MQFRIKFSVKYTSIIITLLIFLICFETITGLSRSSTKRSRMSSTNSRSKSKTAKNTFSKPTRRIQDSENYDLLIEDEDNDHPLPEAFYLFFSSMNTHRIKSMSDLKYNYASFPPPQQCRGFGFPGAIHENLDEKIKNWFSSSPIIKDTVESYINSFADHFKDEIAIGDFRAKDILSTSGPLSKFPCSSHVIDIKNKYGLIGYLFKNIDCREDVGEIDNSHELYQPNDELNMCLIFNSCGTLSVSTDINSLKCLAAKSNIGKIMRDTFFSEVNSITFGMSLQSVFPKDFTIRKLNGLDFSDLEYTHIGNFYFSANGRMHAFPDTVMLGNYKLKDLLQLYNGNFHFSIAAGSPDTQGYRDITQLIQNPQDRVVEKIFNSGLEMIISMEGKISLFLNKITYGVFPDMLLDVESFDIVISKGITSNELPLGIYMRFGGNVIDSASQRTKFLENFLKVIALLDFDFNEFDQEEDLVGALEISLDGIALEFSNKNKRYNCKISFLRPFNFSCQFGILSFEVELEFIYDTTRALYWVFKKVGKAVSAAKEVITKIKSVGSSFATSISEAVKAIPQKASSMINRAKRFLGFSTIKRRLRKRLI